MEFDLVENALHSLSEALSYYSEADEDKNADKFKFCVLLASHCAELLLKEILRKNHPALIFENIDKIHSISDDYDIQTVGYRLALQRVKMLCNVSLNQYESYLLELGKTRNMVQHYKCSIDGEYYKNLMSQTFSAIEFLFLDVLKLHFEDYEEVIDSRDIKFLHEDSKAYNTRKNDILKEFGNNSCIRYKIGFDRDKTLIPPCPICGATLLAQEKNIRCKMCGKEFVNYKDLCENDQACITSTFIVRELGRRKDKLTFPVYICPECDHKSVVFIPQGDYWECLCCNKTFSGMSYCDECGDPIPSDNKIAQLVMSDYDTEDYKYLCPNCASKAKESEKYIGYYFD